MIYARFCFFVGTFPWDVLDNFNGHALLVRRLKRLSLSKKNYCPQGEYKIVRMKQVIIILCWLGIVNNLIAQDKKTIAFKDGVYQSHQDLAKNQPSYSLSKIPYLDYRLDKESNLLFLADRSTAMLPDSEIKSMDNIWGICIKGKPYMKIKPAENSTEVYFVRYYVLGKICYLYYPVFVDKQVEMYVYNPYTGNRVGAKTITNREKILVKKLMVFETGELLDYNKENFMELIKDDKRLYGTLEGLTEIELEEKMFKSLKIYNDRNPILAAQISEK